MHLTSLGAFMEDMSFLLCRVSLVVLLPLLPLGGWRDALSAPVGSLSIPGMLKLLMKNKFASAQRTVMEDFGFFVSAAAAAASRGKRGSCHIGVARRGPQGQQWLLRSWNSWKAAACPTRAVLPGHKAPALRAPAAPRDGTAPSEGRTPPRHHHTAASPGHLAEAVSCPMAGCLWCCVPSLL